MFWGKKAVTLRFVTNNKSAFMYAKPDKSTKFLPAWWKDLAKGQRARENMDMTHCHGFLDLYKKSIILPMWSYLKIDVGVIGTDFYQWEYGDGRSDLSVHPEGQRGSFLPESGYQHIKLISPWLMECDEDISVAWLDVKYGDKNNPYALSGVTKPKQMSGSNINMMLPRGEQLKTYEFDVGDPLVHLIPLTEREVKLEWELVSNEEFSDRQPVILYSKFGRHTKALKQCPFGGK